MKTPRLLSFKWLKCLYCHGVIKLDLTNKPWHVSASKPLSGNLLTDYWMLDAFVSTFFTSLKESFYRHLSYTPSKVLRDILFMKSLRFKKPWLKLQLQYLAQRTGGGMPVRGCRCSLFNGGPQQLNYEERIRVWSSYEFLMTVVCEGGQTSLCLESTSRVGSECFLEQWHRGTIGNMPVGSTRVADSWFYLYRCRSAF